MGVSTGLYVNSVGVFPPGLVRLCALYGGFHVFRRRFHTGTVDLCPLVGNFLYFSRRFPLGMDSWHPLGGVSSIPAEFFSPGIVRLCLLDEGFP